MLDEIVPVLKNFRDQIYQFFPSRQDAAMELVDALSSNTNATSVVELSLNPLHRRNYCSITRVVDEFYTIILFVCCVFVYIKSQVNFYLNALYG